MEENQIAKTPSFDQSDVAILTSDGLSIPAHSSILASASPVLEKLLLDRPGKSFTIRGVPCKAIASFVRFLYSRRFEEEESEMKKYGIHLLVLSHVYQVRELKRACEAGLAKLLDAENVVDVLQLARECDSPYLSIKCMKVISNNFKRVEKTEGWKFLQDHDPWLELHILQLLDEAEERRKKRMRNRKYQSLYFQLSEAMECLQHIFAEGCVLVGPLDVDPKEGERKEPCARFSTCCRGLQLLIRHFAHCKKRVSGGCPHCKRMWRLLRLHSSLCDQTDYGCRRCKVPLCGQFKQKMTKKAHGSKGGGADGRTWMLLVRKVGSAKALSTLTKRERGSTEKAYLDAAPFF